MGDDGSIRRSILASAPLVPRNYVFMEVKQNLVAGDRAENLKRFNLPHFKKVASVVMGAPPAEFIDKVHSKLLETKQRKADETWRQIKQEKDRKKQVAKAQKERLEAAAK